MNKKPLVIDSPSLQSLRQRYLSTFFTFLFWVVWIFLWTPLITLIGWLLGFDLIYSEMIELGGYKGVLADFVLFISCVAIIGCLLGFWALYNFLRFKDVDRRAALAPVNNRQLSAFFAVDPARLAIQQKTQCLTVSFDADGNITASVELKSKPGGVRVQ